MNENSSLHGDRAKERASQVASSTKESPPVCLNIFVDVILILLAFFLISCILMLLLVTFLGDCDTSAPVPRRHLATVAMVMVLANGTFIGIMALVQWICFYPKLKDTIESFNERALRVNGSVKKRLESEEDLHAKDAPKYRVKIEYTTPDSHHLGGHPTKEKEYSDRELHFSPELFDLTATSSMVPVRVLPGQVDSGIPDCLLRRKLEEVRFWSNRGYPYTVFLGGLCGIGEYVVLAKTTFASDDGGSGWGSIPLLCTLGGLFAALSCLVYAREKAAHQSRIENFCADPSRVDASPVVWAKKCWRGIGTNVRQRVYFLLFWAGFFAICALFDADDPPFGLVGAVVGIFVLQNFLQGGKWRKKLNEIQSRTISVTPGQVVKRETKVIHYDTGSQEEWDITVHFWRLGKASSPRSENCLMSATLKGQKKEKNNSGCKPSQIELRVLQSYPELVLADKDFTTALERSRFTCFKACNAIFWIAVCFGLYYLEYRNTLLRKDSAEGEESNVVLWRYFILGPIMMWPYSAVLVGWQQGSALTSMMAEAHPLEDGSSEEELEAQGGLEDGVPSDIASDDKRGVGLWANREASLSETQALLAWPFTQPL